MLRSGQRYKSLDPFRDVPVRSNMVVETETITLPPIVVRWSACHDWHALAADARFAGGVAIPYRPGIYEARYADVNTGECLHIGKASSLRFRVRKGLVKGGVPHSAG